MRHGLALAALLLPLSACVVAPPPPPAYGYGYPPPGYPVPDAGYSGYAYNDGSPTMIVEGAPMPLIFYGGSWGYWDSGRHWHAAPEGIDRNLRQRYPGGVGYHPAGGPGPYGGPPGGPRVGAYPGGGNPYAGHQGGPYGGPGGEPRVGGYPPGGGNPYAGHPGGPYGGPGGAPPSGPGYRPQGQPPVQHAAAPAPARPAPERHRENDNH